MTPLDTFHAAVRQLPLVAILRGLTPAEAPAVGDALVDAGFRLLEVPLNSPQPLESIALMRQRFPDALVGAGTVVLNVPSVTVAVKVTCLPFTSVTVRVTVSPSLNSPLTVPLTGIC